MIAGRLDTTTFVGRVRGCLRVPTSSRFTMFSRVHTVDSVKQSPSHRATGSVCLLVGYLYRVRSSPLTLRSPDLHAAAGAQNGDGTAMRYASGEADFCTACQQHTLACPPAKPPSSPLPPTSAPPPSPSASSPLLSPPTRTLSVSNFSTSPPTMINSRSGTRPPYPRSVQSSVPNSRSTLGMRGIRSTTPAGSEGGTILSCSTIICIGALRIRTRR